LGRGCLVEVSGPRQAELKRLVNPAKWLMSIVLKIQRKTISP